MIKTPWTKFIYEYLLEEEQDLSVGEMLTVVDGVFWYTKHVYYTLVWILLWN
jgi:hypothetical protein